MEMVAREHFSTYQADVPFLGGPDSRLTDTLGKRVILASGFQPAAACGPKASIISKTTTLSSTLPSLPRHVSQGPLLLVCYVLALSPHCHGKE